MLAAMLELRPAQATLWGALAAGFMLRAYAALHDDGMVWPDEIYQTLEPAHHLLFGYGLLPWEFVRGARSWALPGFVAGWLGLFELLGLDSPALYVRALKLVFAAISTLAGAGVYRLARALGGRELDSALAAATYLLCPLALYLGARVMGENLAAALLVWGMAWLVEPGARSSRRVLLGGSLLALAVFARLSSAIVCLVVVAESAWRSVRERSQRPLFASLLLTFTSWALLYGALDALTWSELPDARFGGFMHSAWLYVRFNALEAGGEQWGREPWSYYPVHLLRTMPGSCLLLGLALLATTRRSAGVVAAVTVVAAYCLVHLALGHKELRFLAPILPVACSLVAVGLQRIPTHFEHLAQGGVALTVLLTSLPTPWLTMGDLGNRVGHPDIPAWDFSGSVNRLLLSAHDQPDLCGLRVGTVHLAFSGGSSYLHRPVPIYRAGTPESSRHFNYAITRADKAGDVVARDGELALVRLARSCVADPDYSWRLGE